VDAQRHHTREQFEWWRDVKEAALDCPRTETIDVDALRYDYGAILMPRE
jgi:hypothetical protein